MAYSALAVANAFVKKSKEGEIGELTPMKLQKLVYFAQAWSLKLNGAPLVSDDFEHWPYGPVAPAIYNAFKCYGGREITDFARRPSSNDPGTSIIPTMQDDDSEAWAIVERITKVYGKYSGGQLSNVTHRPGTGWTLTDNGAVISHELMRENINGIGAGGEQHA